MEGRWGEGRGERGEGRGERREGVRSKEKKKIITLAAAL